jgi:hypothetical protein
MLLAGLLAGCGPGGRAWISEDAWHNPLPAETSLAEWDRLPRDRIYEVIEGKIAEAESLLEDVSSVALTDQEASDFIGGPLPAVAGTSPHLVRALFLIRATGSFSVAFLEGQVSVHHGSLGGSPARMNRQPLVLQLDQPPETVYVSVSMAK